MGAPEFHASWCAQRMATRPNLTSIATMLDGFLIVLARRDV